VLLVAVGLVAFRLSQPPALASVRAGALALHVDGAVPAISWPSEGEAAVAVPALGVQLASGPETPAPIASLTKVMAAYVLLRDHPLTTGRSGPTLTMSSADQGEYDDEVAQGISTLPVAAGERLTERQLLQGALLRSAGDYMDAMARWDSGSVDAFVAKMNTTAAALGMHATHYADTTGVDPGSASTPTDQLLLGYRAMRTPAFASTVAMSSATLPLVGTVQSFTPLVGTDGVVGVKSGWTSEAGACDMLALAHEEPATTDGGGRTGPASILVLAVVIGQQVPNELQGVSGNDALAVASAAASGVRVVEAVHGGEALASASVAGAGAGDGEGDGNGDPDRAVAGRPIDVLGWPGQTVHIRLADRREVRAGDPRGTVVGEEIVRVGDQRRSVPLRLSNGLPSETLLQRVA